MPERLKDSPLDLREKDLAKHARCSNCREPVTREVAFYRVAVTQYLADVPSIMRQVGLGVALGSGRLASVMGPDEVMARAASHGEVMLCQGCAFEQNAAALAFEAGAEVPR